VEVIMSLEIKYDVTSDNTLEILINGNNLDYIDSTGLGILMGIYKKLKENNLNIKITNLKPNIYKLFDITGLNKIFNIQE